MALIDFHCHLDLYPDHETLVSECERLGIYTLAVTTTPRAWSRNRDIVLSTKRVRAALGLHPQVVAERAEELSLWEKYLPETRYVGEIGLDASPRYYRSMELQKKVFTRMLSCCAEAGDKILTVHSVRSASVVLDLIEAHLPNDRGRVVLHWFTGTKAEAKRAVELGCYFSINREMANSARGQALIGMLPIERVLTETDGPFTVVNGRQARPADVSLAIDSMAEIRRQPISEIMAALEDNLRRLTTRS